MKLHSNMEVRGKLLLVVVSGEGAFNEAWDLLKEIYDAALEKRLNFILIDTVAAKGKFTTVDRYQLGAKTVVYLGSRQMHPRIAVVGNPPTADGFGVLVAKNRWVAVEMFSDRQAALNWLGLAKTEP